MSYTTVEGLWLTRIRAMSQFDSDNSSRGNWGKVGNGAASQYAILHPGEHAYDLQAMGGNRHTVYQTIIQLYQRYVEEGTTLQNLEILEQAVRDELNQYRLMGDTSGAVVYARVVRSREMIAERETPDGPPIWLRIDMVGETLYEESVTLAE